MFAVTLHTGRRHCLHKSNKCGFATHYDISMYVCARINIRIGFIRLRWRVLFRKRDVGIANKTGWPMSKGRKCEIYKIAVGCLKYGDGFERIANWILMTTTNCGYMTAMK